MINASQARENLKFDRAIRLTEAIKKVGKLIEQTSVGGKRECYFYDFKQDIEHELIMEIKRHDYNVSVHRADVRDQHGDYLKISF
ncbi:hypothetical protein phiAS5_ORF0094 [Aeromonas phage phiAS5]|uniref:Uncharacterized protein n=1 Tax=Aeromonas phage phiAS5 TaxID=879630 RepID=E1A2J1_9CAUD|nr:hypothetical protein phiAS5_ORF0094 [Aeromonas phage phiAS5]ADM79937.1 hypothetical protein phiAS5_ORF0094 [Aeromonas phage phiAS5]BES53292.1 hypothetical protein [Aeromonas phage phiWae14]